MGKGRQEKEGYSTGVIVGRALSLPFKAAVGVGKITIKVAGKALGTAIKIAADTQSEYNNMGSKSVEDIGDVISGKKQSTLAEKAATIKYVRDVKKRLDEDE